MGIIIKIIATLFLSIITTTSIYIGYRSGHIIYKIWKQDIDLKATKQKLWNKVTGNINFIVLKDKMAIYKDEQIVAYTRYEPTKYDNYFLFSTVYMQGEADELKKLTNGDVVVFRNQK